MDEVLNFVTKMDYLDWGIPGLILFILHFAIKSQIIKWSGVGAVIVSIISLISPDLGWTIQWVTFCVLFILGLYLNRGDSV